MSRRKNPRCAACGRRVRRNQPYVIAVSRQSAIDRHEEAAAALEES